MQNLIFFDSNYLFDNFLPLTFLRPSADLRIGILKIHEKWQKRLENDQISFLTKNYLQDKFKINFSEKNIYINGNLLPNENICLQIKDLAENESIFLGEYLLAFVSKKKFENYENLYQNAQVSKVQKINEAKLLINIWDLFLENRDQIVADFELITKNRKSLPIKDPNTVVYGKENIFLEEGAKVKSAILDAEDAPIYLGKNSTVELGAIIRGAFAICEGGIVGMGAKMRGNSTFGKFCKVGGEVNNSIFQDFSNKGHDGFLGNSLIGEWCNFGADSNTSNMKNNYSQVKIWDFNTNNYISSNLQFVGVIMGDHVKCGINTMLNTGTVVGTGANIFDAGFPPKFVPPFAWGNTNNFQTFRLAEMLETCQKVMLRRNQNLSKIDQKILETVFEQTQKYRFWE